MIEETIDKLTAAIEALTAATLAGTCATPTEAPAKEKPAAKKAAKKKVPDPEPEETEEEEGGIDREAVLLKITEHVKLAFNDPDRDRGEDKETFMKLRKSYGVEKAAELPDDKLEEFYDATVAALS